jgi:hypothetical protein
MKQNIKELVVLIQILTCLSLLTASCTSQANRSSYKINVKYIADENSFVPDLRNGIVVLDFIGSFEKDSLTILVNNRDFLRTIISTDAMTGKAFLAEIDSLKRVNEICVKINSGKNVIINCDKRNQLFTLSLVNDTLFVKSVTHIIPGR